MPKETAQRCRGQKLWVSERSPIHSVLSKPRNVSNVVPAQLMTVLEQVSCLGLALDRQNSFKDAEIGRNISSARGHKSAGGCHGSQVIRAHLSTSKNTAG